MKEEEVQSVIDAVEAAKDLSPREFRMAVEIAISNLFPFDHKNTDTFEACGIDADETSAALKSLPDGGSASRSETINTLEKTLTKREALKVMVESIHKLMHLKRNPLVAMLAGMGEEEEE